MHPRFLLPLLLTVFLDKRLRICVFREWIVCQINQPLTFVGQFDFLVGCRFVISNEVHLVIVNTVFISSSYRSIFNYFDLPVFLSLHSCLAQQQLRSEIFFFQLVQRSLAYFSLFEGQVTGQILGVKDGTLAEQERVGTKPLLTESLRPQAGFQVGRWAVVIQYLQQSSSHIVHILIQMRSFWRVARWLPLIAVPKLWSSRLMLNSTDNEQEKPVLIQQTLNEVKPELVVVQVQPKGQEQTERTEEKAGKLVEHELEHKVQQVQSKQEEAVGPLQGEKQQNHIIEDNLSKKEQKLNEQKQDKVASTQEIQVKQNSSQRQTEPQIIDPASLKPNQVLISLQCSFSLRKYLQLAGYEPIISSNLSEPAVIKNSRNDILTLTPFFLTDKYYLQTLANFINPPQILTTTVQAKELLTALPKDNFIVMTFIPDPQSYEQLMKSRTTSVFDLYTLSRKVDLHKVQKHFVDYSYCSSSNKNMYVIARTQQVADFLKINTFNIGFPYILNKSTKQSGGESNLKLVNEKYKVSDVRKTWDFTQNIEKSAEDRNQINKMTHFYLNRIENEVDLENKIRQIQMAGDKRKVLLFCTQEQREEFHTKTEEILQKVARLQKDNVIVIKTSNQSAIKRVFKVEPDNFATIRLIDVNSKQDPLFPEGNNNKEEQDLFFQRYKYKGPFKIQNLCNFIQNSQLQEYYESKKKVTTIKTVQPKELLTLSNTLVLFEKEGCEGCKYTRESLDELKKIIEALNSGGRIRKNLIYRFAIEDPQGLSRIILRRYNIFNDNPNFKAPTITPKLFYFDEGKSFDLDVQKCLSKLNQVKAGQSPEQADDAVIADIIQQIRLKSQSSSSDL